MAQAQITITANLYDLVGRLQPAAKLRLQLCGFGAQIPRVPGTGLLASTAPLDIYAQTIPTGSGGGGGEALFTVWGNDVITPSGTFYTLTALDQNNNAVQANAYQFTGAGPYDLTTAASFNPNPVYTPAPQPVLPVTSQFIRLNYGTNLALPGPVATLVTYACLLTGDVAMSAFLTPPVAGQLIGFLVSQDSVVGGHAFAYPPDVVGAAPVADWKSARNYQLFMAADDGFLYPTGVASQN